MGSTPRGYPYPTLTDAPNGPSQMQALAAAIDTDVTAVAAAATPPAWTTISSFATGASPTSGAYPPAFRLLPSGKVELRGGLTAGASFATGGVVLFTLPSLTPTVYPTYTVLLPAATNYSSGYTTNSEWQITPSGQVSLFVAAGITACSLDNVFYYTT